MSGRRTAKRGIDKPIHFFVKMPARRSYLRREAGPARTPQKPLRALLAALEVEQVIRIEGAGLTEADRAVAQQAHFVAVERQFVVVTELDPGTVGRTVGDDKVAALVFDQRVVA